MKICVASSWRSLDDIIDTRFGRCQYFIIADTKNLQFETIQNPGLSAGGAAGIQAAQLLVDKGIEAVLTGNIGPKAFKVLTEAGIKIVAGLSGVTVKQAIEGFKAGQYQYSALSSVESHYGTGMGLGWGMGRGRCMGVDTPQRPQPTLSKKEELKSLHQQCQEKNKELEMIQERIDELLKDGQQKL